MDRIKNLITHLFLSKILEALSHSLVLTQFFFDKIPANLKGHVKAAIPEGLVDFAQPCMRFWRSFITPMKIFRKSYNFGTPIYFLKESFFDKMTLINPVSNQKRQLNLPFRKSGSPKSGIRIFGIFFSTRFHSLPNATTFISDIFHKNYYSIISNFTINQGFFFINSPIPPR